MAALAGNALELLVIQATPFCNLDCTYCYLPDRNSRHRASERTLDTTFRRVFESPYIGKELTVVWHSGEPLVLPIEYYRIAFAIAERHRPPGLTLSHSFQTNGTLLTADWARFILESKARIGISIDGPREMHDRYRRTRSGSGSFDRVMAGIRLLQQHDVPFHVITVLTREAIAGPEALYRFYRETGIERVCFNIEEIEGQNGGSSLAAPAVARQFRSFLRRFLDLVKAEPEDQLWVREFTNAAGLIARSGSVHANQQSCLFSIISVDAGGNVSTYSPELLGMRSDTYGDFTIGNVHTHSLAEMRQAASGLPMTIDIAAGVERCRKECHYFGLCGGGAPANKLYENGSFDSTETMYCRLGKMAVIDVVLADIERDLGLQRRAAANA
jgi:uncharacterized protein